jgi:hypothetical protein
VGPSSDEAETSLEDARLFGPEARNDAVEWLRVAAGTAEPWLLTDLDGEPRRATELADDLIATGTGRMAHEDLWELFGDVGAATIPLLAVYAAVANRFGFAPAERTVVRAGGLEMEGLGAVLLGRGANHA